ncbi:MAG TPA: FHA domain-containing protein [Pyrinomonadaceae bacterium]|nr:FHA domain-containing protein [Pyrinomonadaceae bacterium]
MQTQASKFVIIREDMEVDPTTVVADGLKIGRLPTCEMVLNHPTVSRLHAGLNEAGGRYYLYNFSQSSGTTLNGRVVPTESVEVIADGDAVQIGPFFLYFERQADALVIRVTLEVAVHVGEAEGRVELQHAEPQYDAQQAAREQRQTQESSEVAQALSVFWEKRKREAGKMQRLSPLRPHKPARVLGKSRFNWTPTRDLVRPWPFSVFVWGFALVAVFSVVAAVVYAETFMPAPISTAHARSELQAQPAIARHANASTCTACHTLTGSMEAKCSSCHTADGFAAAVTEPHAAAGVGCTSCHVEHQGTEFRPSVASLQTCNNCHNDQNALTYNGKRVGTPHGGGIGYPVADGRWSWRGLTAEEWERKSPEVRQVMANFGGSVAGAADGSAGDNARRSAEFHALHMHRVKVVEGLQGNTAGEMSCSTCHASFSPIDRETPRTTCGSCHNGDRGGKFERVLASNQPNCISCHTQHPQGRRTWGASLLAGGAGESSTAASSSHTAAPGFVSALRR